ncbi:BREX-1 system adenine-specific DNA-methyltransferase PglX [Nocardia rhamnosiphila]
MNTAVLKDFATSARATLNEQMLTRIAHLRTGTGAALEYPREIAMLNAAVERHGPEGAAEIAAYTWFNRLTAARYMDVRGYSGVFRIVSPEPGSVFALPEILTRAHAGEFPDDLVPTDTQDAVNELLSGRRISPDADLEAYTLMLHAVFRAWNNPLPEVFPAAVDWIRLLTPVDILAPSSVRADAVAAIDNDTCTDVEVVGWLYQYYNAELKARINESKVPIDAAELGPVTQLFTPHWIVRYLVENSLGRLWLRSRPSSGLRTHMDYYVEPVAGQDDTGAVVTCPQEIRLVDPACGSGHLLTYAFDLLYRIYEEEGHPPSRISALILRHNLCGLEIDARAAQLASFALAIKARERDPRFLTRGIQPNIVHLTPIEFSDDEAEAVVSAIADLNPAADTASIAHLLHTFTNADTFGSLLRVDTTTVESLAAELDALENGKHALYTHHAINRLTMLVRQARALVDRQYHVVIANPPYLGSGNMGYQLKNWVEKNYPTAKADLLTAFMVRATEICIPSGHWGMVVLPSWMFLKTFAKFREFLLRTQRVESFLHLGRGLFGSDFGSDAFTMTNTPAPHDYRATYRRLFEEHVQVRKPEIIEALFKNRGYNRFETRQTDLALVPESPIVYWLSDAMKAVFGQGTRLADIASPRQGLATADNDRFLRYWFEVSSDGIGFGMSSRREAQESCRKWFPHNKGGSFRKWWGNQDYVINWEHDGKELLDFRPRAVIRNPDYYFKPCVSWSRVSAGFPSFRSFPHGFTFNDVAPSISMTADEQLTLHGLLNSSVATATLAILSPTLHFEVGHIANLPVLPIDPAEVARIVEELISTYRADWNDYEISWSFEMNPLVAISANGGRLDELARIHWKNAVTAARGAQELEERNNIYFADLYSLRTEVSCEVPLNRVSLTQNPYFRYAPTKGGSRTEGEYRALFDRDLAKELLSYAVGCIMGRYSLDRPGLVLADAGATLDDFDRLVPNARFRPDTDGIIPITAESYFEDDIVIQVRMFLDVAFGRQYVDANVAWLEQALGNGNRMPLRKYFLEKFYDDHVKMYSKRPIYWQASSQKGGFNALFYIHRYTPATLGVLHQTYAEEHQAKLSARVDTIEHALGSAGKAESAKLVKERDGLRAQIREVRGWIQDHLFPLASAEIPVDLDDGVKRNYPKLSGVLRKVSGL